MPSRRMAKYQEFLHTLQEATGLSTPDLARACGKQPTNMSQYLSGTKRPGLDTIRSAIRSLRDSWPVFTVMEVQPIPPKLATLPRRPGIYALYGSSGDVLYVGQATNLRAEVTQTLNRKANLVVRRGPDITSKAHSKYKSMAKLMTAYVVPPQRLRHNLEALLLRMFPNELHNNKMGNFKRTPWSRSGKPRPRR